MLSIFRLTALATTVVLGLSACSDDNNCATVTFFPDADGDGLGAASSAGRQFCVGEQPADFVQNNDDADDNDPNNGVPPPLDVALQFGTTSQIAAPDFTIHSYTANISEQHVSAYSVYIVEGSESLFILDMGIDSDIGDDVKRITDAIGKPVEAIIISHAHPDHIGGLTAFPNTPLYATEITANILRVGIPAFFVPAFPNINTLPLGENTMAGVSFMVDRKLDTESGENAIIDFGEQAGLVFVNDLLFIDEHAFIGQGSVNKWLEDLAGFTVNYGDYHYVLTSHGGYGDADAVIADNIVYFNRVLEEFDAANTMPEFFAGLAGAYPEYATVGIWGFSTSNYWLNHLSVPDTITVDGMAYMEGLAIVGTTQLFTSNFTNGEISVTNFKRGNTTVFAEATEDSATGWGLDYHAGTNRLYSLKNAPLPFFVDYFADPVNNIIPVAGVLDIYDVTTGEHLHNLILPDNAKGNAVTVDADGNAYITDFGQARILKYYADTNNIEVWANTDFGFLGGVVPDGEGNVYAHGGVNNALLHIAINDDGSAGMQTTINLTGETLTAGDGLTWAGNNTLYSTSGANSVVRITLDGEGGGVVDNVIPEDPGMYPTSLKTLDLSSFTEARNFLFVNDGQLGTPLFGLPAPQSFTIRTVRTL